VFWQSMGGVVVPAGAALATPPDSIHAESHGAITVCRDRLRRVGVPAVGAATAPPQVLTTCLQHQESRVTYSQNVASINHVKFYFRHFKGKTKIIEVNPV